MVELLKKAMDCILEKEQDSTNNSKIDQIDLDKLISYVEKKRNTLKKVYDDNISEMEYILNRLHSIKAKSLKTDRKCRVGGKDE